MQADMIMFEPYKDINLDENPCIFTQCGHIFTVESMDGIMGMAAHYDLNADERPISLKSPSAAFSQDSLKTCPTCRGSLRGIARYGRIVRRALLDESTKKFTAWSTIRHEQLANWLVSEQERLLNSFDSAERPSQSIRLVGDVTQQVRAVKDLRNSYRYRHILGARHQVLEFLERCDNDEQPFKRVRDLVETARRDKRDNTIARFDFSIDVLDLRGQLLAKALWLRCDIILFSDVLSLHHSNPLGPSKGVLQVSFGKNREESDKLVTMAGSTKNYRQEVEGQMFWARFAAMECSAMDATGEGVNPR